MMPKKYRTVATLFPRLYSYLAAMDTKRMALWIDATTRRRKCTARPLMHVKS